MPAPESDLLHEWLQHTVALSPSAVAIVEEERITTFSALFEAASTLAGNLRDMGLEPGSRVALVLSKTTDAVIAVFATLLAGGVYVPIHPQWPSDRIEAVLDDSGASIVIDTSGVTPRPARPHSGTCPAGTAVILFTSGSTGRPKGVVLSHRAVAAFVRWSAAEFQVGPDDRIACPSPLGFDLSTFDLFNMALCGAACVLVPASVALLPRFLVRHTVEHRVTCWYSVPSILSRMLRDGGLNRQTSGALRTVLFAGEVCPAPDLSLLIDAAPHAACANLYGPTETNVVTFYRVPAGLQPSDPPPIGRPCPFATIRIDQTTGELLAAGESLMTGYWNCADDTKRAFVSFDGRRYYRTGDRVRLDVSGEIHFVGRLDRQVKRRGCRIELGEIEIALSRHPDIVECGVVASVDQGYQVSITAFVRPSGELSLFEAKAHCAKTLPSYMAPDQIRFAPALPRGARGKIDYSALQRLAEESIDGD